MDVHYVSLHPTLDLRERAPSLLDAIQGFFHERSRVLFIPGVFLPNRYVQNMAFINTHQLRLNPGLCFVPVSEVHPFFSLLLSLIKRNVPLEPWLCTSAVQDCFWQSTRTCIDSRMKSAISCKVLLKSEQKHLRTLCEDCRASAAAHVTCLPKQFCLKLVGRLLIAIGRIGSVQLPVMSNKDKAGWMHNVETWGRAQGWRVQRFRLSDSIAINEKGQSHLLSLKPFVNAWWQKVQPRDSTLVCCSAAPPPHPKLPLPNHNQLVSSASRNRSRLISSQTAAHSATKRLQQNVSVETGKVLMQTHS